MFMSNEDKPHSSRECLGTPVAEGIAVGKAKIVDVGHFPVQVPRYRIAQQDISREVKRFRSACTQARKDLDALAAKIEVRLGKREADLIRGQALMIDDPTFIAEIEELVIEEQSNVEAAVADVMGRFEQLIESLDDPYLRERSLDVRDAGRRILANLLFVDGNFLTELTEPSVVVSSHLVPSLTVHLDRDKILAFATEKGGATSHAAILARSLNIPAVTGLENLTAEVMDGETVIVDGARGKVFVNPTEQRLIEYKAKADTFSASRQQMIARSKGPVATHDGVAVSVYANVGRPQDIAEAVEFDAKGIGLYRTEFDYFNHSVLPTEEALSERYGAAAEAFGKKGVALRLLDIGGDKFPPALPMAHEENPFMGMRGLRLLLEHVDDLMLPQMRAILRAAAKGRVSLIYPMVTGVEELDAALKVFERARDEVRAEGLPDVDVPQGIMIEVPSCIPILPELLQRSHFATVGTNDLVQYLLAADRNSERMVSAYDPFKPAVLRTLKAISVAAQEESKPVSVCGEIAGASAFIPLLLGLGYRAVSVNVGAIPRVKQAIRALSLADCELQAREALKSSVSIRTHR